MSIHNKLGMPITEDKLSEIFKAIFAQDGPLKDSVQVKNGLSMIDRPNKNYTIWEQNPYKQSTGGHLAKNGCNVVWFFPKENTSSDPSYGVAFANSNYFVFMKVKNGNFDTDQEAIDKAHVAAQAFRKTINY